MIHMQWTNSVIFLSLVWMSKASATEKICTVGEPSPNVSCSLESNGCPEGHVCVGALPGLRKGHCCKDPYTWLCRRCIAVNDIYYNVSQTSSVFHVSVSFRWDNKDCSQSARTVLDLSINLIAYDQKGVIIQRILNCRSSKKPCRKFFMMNVPSQNYSVVYLVETLDSTIFCPYNEIAHVSLTSSSSSTLPPPQPASPPQALSPTVTGILAGLMCVIVVVTGVVYWRKNCWQSSRRDHSMEQNNTDIELALIDNPEGAVMAVAMPEVGTSLLEKLEHSTGLSFLTVHNFQEEIFQNASEWMDTVELRYNKILFLLTADLVNESEDISNPLNTISRSLFVRLHRSVRRRGRRTFYVYLESSSSIRKYVHTFTGKQYNLFQKDVHCKDFRRLVSDLKTN